MANFKYTLKNDYDKRIKFQGEYVFCYSKKKLDEMYPGGEGLSLSGEAYLGADEAQNKFEAKQQKRLQKRKERGEASPELETLKTGELKIGNNNLGVYPGGTNGKFFSKCDGYVPVGENSFITLHSSRIPFLIAVAGIGAAIIAAVILIIVLLMNPGEPEELPPPENPLPVVDPNVVPNEDDDSEKIISEEGGGAVSMVYTKDAEIKLSTEMAKIYFNNPNASNHDVVLEFYVVSGETGYFLGRSGRVPAGSSIYEISIADREVEIKEGEYEGLYVLSFYNPETGERAVVDSQIAGITIKVTQ